MQRAISLGVAGAAGRMGTELCRMLAGSAEFAPSCALDVVKVGQDWGVASGIDAIGVEITDNIEVFLASNPDVIVDLSIGDAAAVNVPVMLQSGARVIVGATGIKNEVLESFERTALTHGGRCIVVPNFSIGANLMIAMARKAAPYYPAVEIVERHHPGKKDAPSGTALFTVSEIAAANPNIASTPVEHESVTGVRGGILNDIRIHSIRMPGTLAEQTVTFGCPGETLEITHRSVSRDCFMLGVILAIKFILDAEPGLTIGLDQVMGLI